MKHIEHKVMLLTVFAIIVWVVVMLRTQRSFNVHAAPERIHKQVTLSPDQIKKAICEGERDTNGTYFNCWVFPKGSTL